MKNMFKNNHYFIFELCLRIHIFIIDIREQNCQFSCSNF